MSPRFWLMLGAVLGGLGVAIGAFGAHGLEAYLAKTRSTEVATRNLASFESGVRYHMYHALAIVLVGLLAAHGRTASLSVAGWCFTAGVLLFSGFIYAYVLTLIKPLVHIVPIGGVLFMVGWFALAAAGAKLLAGK